MPRGIMFVFSNPVDGREEEFNAWYDEVHVPHMLSVPGILNCTRLRVSDVEIYPGGALRGYRYLALYDIDAGTDEGFERVADDLRKRFLGGAAPDELGDVALIASRRNDEMPLSDALDLASVRDSFATVLSCVG